MKRLHWLLLAAALVAAWVWLGAPGELPSAKGAGSSARRAPPAREPGLAAPGTYALAVGERLSDAVSADPFAPLDAPKPAASAAVVKASAPRPAPKKPEILPAPAVAATPPPPPPPPLTVIGSISGAGLGGGKPVAFVQYQGSVHPVSEGDTVGGAYKVTAFAQDRLELLHLPSQQKQVISLPRP